MKNSNKDIGDIYRDTFKDYRIEPSDKAWSNIESKLTKLTAVKPGFFKNNYFIGITSFVIVAILVFVIFRNSGTTEDLRNIETVENISPVTGTELEEEDGIAAIDAGKEQYQPNEVTTHKADGQEKTITNSEQKSPGIKTSSEKRVIKDQKILEDNNKTEHLPVESKVNTENVKSNIENDDVATAEVIVKGNEKDDAVIEDEANEVSDNVDNVLGDLPVDPVELPEDQKICKGDETQLEVKGGLNYEWNNGENQRLITVKPMVTTIYAVTVTDALNNIHYANVMVEVLDCKPLFVPDAFTPDGDGLNDEFKAKGTNITDFFLRVHSRSGNVIFETDNINIGWDGRIKGNMAQPGVYFYTIRFVDTYNKVHNLKGHLTLLR